MASYDEWATTYNDRFRGYPENSIADRGLIGMFADYVAERGQRVADLGCGPGHGTAYLARQGLDPIGIDISAPMIGYARREYPDLDFRVGDLAATGLADASLDGALAWCSIIHTPPEQLDATFAEFRRIVATNGYVAIGFLATDGDPAPVDHTVATAYVLPPATIEALLTTAGFRTVVSSTRAPGDGERFRIGAVIAVRSAQG